MQLINRSLPIIKQLNKEKELKLIGHTDKDITLYITQIGYIAAVYNSKPVRGKGLGAGQIKELLILNDYIKFARTGATIDSPEAHKHIIKRYSFNEYNKDNFDLNKAVERAVINELNKRNINK